MRNEFKNEYQFLICGVILSFITFFYEADKYATHFIHVANLEYQQFSARIFDPQSRFYVESILVPLLGKFLGPSKSGYAYQMFTAIFQFAILPVTAVIFSRHIADKRIAFAALFLFAISFTWLRHYWLGFPDPVTILCLIVATTASSSRVTFLAAVLASLSHYTLTLFALIAASATLATDTKRARPQGISICRRVFLFISALVIGKIILLLWFWVFKYTPAGRFSHVMDAQAGFFLKQYLDSPTRYWITPGLLFITVNLGIFFFLLAWKRSLAIGQLSALAVAYICVFLSEDGLRIFSVVISASYVLLLIKVTPDIAFGITHVIQSIKRRLFPD
jgi:hypothetical protein